MRPAADERRLVRARAPNIARVAGVVQRLAVLLAAGVAPVAAWGYLREGALPARVAATASGQDVPNAIVAALGLAPAAEAPAWRGLATAWAVATDAGAPLAPTLRDFAGSLRDLGEAQREIAVALAAPVATARLVMALPAVGVVFGIALGFNTLGMLFTTPVGWGCLGVGGTLMFAASRWNRRLVRSAQPRSLTPGLEFDLVAIGVSGGAALDRARASVGVALDRYSEVRSLDSPDIDAVLDLSRRAGVPAADLLRSEATERRREARAEVQERAQALSVRLMIPLGVCVLPAFMVLGVLPLLVSVIGSTSVTW
jgi:tight adherence protein B